jgi:FAD/FMN-containing dehydrogenase
MPITDTLITAAGTPRALTGEPANLPPLIWPGDDECDAARAAWNLHVDERPACICVATQVENVQAAVAYARAGGLQIAAQTTGHLSQAPPPLERTMLLKLALHDGDFAVDPRARVVRVKAGATWGDVVDAVAPHGLAAMHGSSPSVGVIGYLLGGGAVVLRASARARGQPCPRVRGRDSGRTRAACRR